MFLASENSGHFIRKMFYQQLVANEDKKAIGKLSVQLTELKENKTKVEENKIWLAQKKKEMETKVAFMEEEIAKTEDYLNVLSSKIAALTVKQEQFLKEKLDSLDLPKTLGAGSLFCIDDRGLNPGFSPAFAFYTFGIPHRVGMSQYGAYGRAKAGQSYDEILRAYYNFDGYVNKANVQIKVNNGDGVNEGTIIWTGSLEEYVKRIDEIPASWPIESLKAQAIAARSYALSTTDNGKNSICDKPDCQVFKEAPKGGAWDQAVNSTAGETMVVGGEPITAWYASTAGGYTFTNSDIWGGSTRSWTKRLKDTIGSINSFSELLEKAYDKDSPCMYSAQGWRSEYGNSAWLKPEEVADITNVILLARKDTSTREHLYQTDKPNPSGVETWNSDRVKVELKSRGISPYNSVSNISITSVDWAVGKTTGIKISGDAGANDFGGAEFANFFNLRAPANIQIVGPLFNVEKN
jgi:SpoIID/LytB domain protein